MSSNFRTTVSTVRFGGVSKPYSSSPPRRFLPDLDLDAEKGADHALLMAKRYKSNVKAVFKKAMAAADAGDADDALEESQEVMTLCERLAEQAEGLTALVEELESWAGEEVPEGLKRLPANDVVALLEMDDVADIAEMLEGVIQQFLF